MQIYQNILLVLDFVQQQPFYNITPLCTFLSLTMSLVYGLSNSLTLKTLVNDLHLCPSYCTFSKKQPQNPTFRHLYQLIYFNNYFKITHLITNSPIPAFLKYLLTLLLSHSISLSRTGFISVSTVQHGLLVSMSQLLFLISNIR